MAIPLPGRTVDQMHRLFRWPDFRAFNVGAACCDLHPPGRLALVYVGRHSELWTMTFRQLSELSGRLASAYLGIGLRAGDRVAVCLPQRPETALAHLAAYKAGLIAVPLSALFGPDALSYRLGDSGARLLVTDAEGLERCRDLPGAANLNAVILAGEVTDPGAGSAAGAGTGSAAGRPKILSFDDAIAGASAALPAAPTRGDDPCLLVYTSGTTGPPKGVLHGHRVLVGQAPGFRLGHEYTPQPGDRFWTPADWAWVGGLVNSLLLAWFHGLTVVTAWRQGFDPEWATQMMARYQVRNTFLPTTALRMILQAPATPGVRLRTIVSGGEAQEQDLLDRCITRFGIGFNESYGQTEADFIVGNCSARWPVRAGSAGISFPGHEVRVMREDGTLCPAGEIGEIVVKCPDPVLLLRYWHQPEATAAKFAGPWLRTGDLGSLDEASYLWFHARADDVIKSSGYRIGPAEVEGCLLRHLAVREAAVVGAPDELRGQVVHAYIVPAAGPLPAPGLGDELRRFVRERLAAYQYPRRISFVDDLPRTATNKVDRAALRRRAASEALGSVPGSSSRPKMPGTAGRRGPALDTEATPDD
jgi:acetyl-CoA synthetase